MIDDEHSGRGSRLFMILLDAVVVSVAQATFSQDLDAEPQQRGLGDQQVSTRIHSAAADNGPSP